MIPKQAVVDPTTFGRDGAAWEAAGVGREAGFLRAAGIQHDAAVYVRRYLATVGLTQGDLARALGWRRERLSRLLAGRVWASLPDLEMLLGACGSSIGNVVFQGVSRDERPGPMRQVVVGYLRDQLRRMEESSPAAAQTPFRR